MGSVGAWICGWSWSNFSVVGVFSVGLKNFGVGSVGSVGPEILAQVTWMKHFASVAWVHKILVRGSKNGVGQKTTMWFKCLAV